ncbi:MAG: hypothetical protein PHD95_04260 [Candidatus ainarchaeum sp.]|nr:hypothetical protein [Candidatus ainarchaeum sp.]
MPESEKKRILMPILSKQEGNTGFLEQIPKEAEEIFLLLVIDTGFMPGMFGFAASDIAAGNVLMQLIRKFFVRRRKKCFDIEEWGNTERKILQTIHLKKIGTVFLVKQDNQFYRELVEQIRSESEAEIIEIELPRKEKETKKEQSDSRGAFFSRK